MRRIACAVEDWAGEASLAQVVWILDIWLRRRRRPFCPDAIGASGQASRRTPNGARLHKRLGQGAVEEFDYVQYFLAGVAEGGAGAELQDAAGIGGGDYLGFGLLYAVHFAVEEF